MARSFPHYPQEAVYARSGASPRLAGLAWPDHPTASRTRLAPRLTGAHMTCILRDPCAHVAGRRSEMSLLRACGEFCPGAEP
jgi:hypothetical protein